MKNVKIEEAVHRQMSIRAAKLGVQKSDLTCALIMLGLTRTDEDIMQAIYAAQAEAQSQEYRNQGRENDEVLPQP